MGDTSDTPDLVEEPVDWDAVQAMSAAGITQEQARAYAEQGVSPEDAVNYHTILNMTPEEQDRFNQLTYGVASREPLSGVEAGPNVPDGDNQYNSWEGIHGSSLTSPYGTNDGTYIPVSRYTGFINPHGGQTFYGVKPNGQKEIITREEAMALGYTPADTSTGDFYDQADWDANLITGGDQRQDSNDDFQYEVPGTGITLPPGPLPTEPWTPPIDNNPGTWVPPTYGTGGGTFTPTGEGAVSGPAPIDWSGIQAPESPLMGYESSSNKDFYQQQFANMRDQAATDRLRQDAAAAYVPEERTNVMDDPWGWANLPDVVQAGQYPEGQTANDWILDSRFTPETTNAQAIGQLSGLPAFTQEEQTWFTDWINENPQEAAGNYYSQGYQPAMDRIAGYTNFDEGNKARLNQIVQNMYTRRGDALTPGGMAVPPGYASPTNA